MIGRRILVGLLTLFVGLLSACAAGNPCVEIGSEIGIHLERSVILEDTDSHGGFHGDGIRIVTVEVEAADRDTIRRAPGSISGWKSLPMEAVLLEKCFGDEAWLTREDGEEIFPLPEEGVYYFRDRHSAVQDPHDAQAVWQRASFNFTLAVYDASLGQLYYLEFDT